MLLFVLFATATCMSTAPKNTIEENTMSQNELKNKTGPTFIDTVSATKLQMEKWMGKQDEEERTYPHSLYHSQSDPVCLRTDYNASRPHSSLPFGL